MATQTVEVAVPDGVFAGDAFLIEFNGQQLNVTCPDGCGPGVTIQIEVPAGDEEAPAPQPQTVEVVIPDGLFPGDEFLVEFNGQQFNVGVPDGCAAGDPIVIERFAYKPESSTSSDLGFAYGLGGFGSSSAAEKAPAPAASKADRSAEWAPTPSIFSMGPPAELNGEIAGDFTIGQLVQVTRSDGSWTYGKIMSYDEGGDNYTVMTKMGPKYMVERDALTDDIVVNPSDGSCAQQ